MVAGLATLSLAVGCGKDPVNPQKELLVDLSSPSTPVEFTEYEQSFAALSWLEENGLTAGAVEETLKTEGWERIGIPPGELQLPGFKAWYGYGLRYPVRPGTGVEFFRNGAPLPVDITGPPPGGIPGAAPPTRREAWIFKFEDYFVPEGIYVGEARRYAHPVEDGTVVARYEPDPASVRKTELRLSGQPPGEFCRRYVTLGDQTRYALYVPGRSRLEFHGLEPSEGAELRFGAALLSSPGEPWNKGVRFEVRFSREGGGERVLFSTLLDSRGSGTNTHGSGADTRGSGADTRDSGGETLDSRPGGAGASGSETSEGWRDFRVPLGSVGKRRGTLSLVTRMEGFDSGYMFGGLPEGAGTRAAWSRPVITGSSRLSGGGATGSSRLSGAGDSVPGGDRPRRIILILIDTLRRDHLGCYGYGRPVSPAIDSLAADGTIFEDAVSHSSWTRPSVASLFASRYPRNLGILSESYRQVLPEGHALLAEMFRKGGYATAALVANVHLKPYFGLHRGFDSHYFYMKRADGLTCEAIDWIEKHRDLPFFLYLHYADPHSPYIPHDDFDFMPGYDGAVYEDPQVIFRGEEVDPGDSAALDASGGRDYSPPVETRTLSGAELEKMVALYDGEIRFTDYHLSRLFGKLREMELDENTLIVITSDHGEEFRDHGGYFHGYTLFGEQLRVPLIFSRPSGGSRGGLVRLIDLAPTLCELCGIPAADRWSGGSFAGDLLTVRSGGEKVASEISKVGKAAGVATRGVSKAIDAAAEGVPGISKVETAAVEPASKVPKDEITAAGPASKVQKTEVAPSGITSQSSEERFAVGETMFRGEHRISLRQGTVKLIYDARLDEWAYYDLKTDPEETRNLSNKEGVFADRKETLENWMENNTFGDCSEDGFDAPPPDAATVEQLKSLGYLQ